jgi:hypothetical protein
MSDRRVLNLPLNKKLVKSQRRGGKEFSYIEASAVSRILDAAYGDEWSFHILDKWKDEIGDYDVVYNVHGSLTVVTTDSTGKPTLETTREYLASSSLRDAILLSAANPRWSGYKETRKLESEGVKFSELLPQHYQTGATANVWKATATDCLKKCASQFGVASELYGENSDGSLFKEIFTEDQVAKMKRMADALSGTEIEALIREADIGRTKGALHMFNVDDLLEAAMPIVENKEKEKKTE